MMKGLTLAMRFLLAKIQLQEEWGRESYLVANWNEERTAMALHARGLISIIRYEKVNARVGSFQSRPLCKIIKEKEKAS